MKKIVFVLSLVLILALSSVTAFADGVIISIDSSKVEFNDELGFPFIDENNRTQVPFRAALEKLGAEVEWNSDEGIAIARKGDIVVEVPIGENYIIKNGERISVDTTARIINGRTYLPIREVIVAFGSDVEWDAKLKTVVITTEQVDAKALYFAANEKSYSWKNYDMKAIIDMSMDVPDAAGSVQTQKMTMNMDMTIFMNPIKAKINASMLLPIMQNEIMPIMDMYMTMDEKGITQYMGMNDGTGNLSWMKQTIAMDMLSDLMKNDVETIQKNKVMSEKYTKDVKYFGIYTDEDGRTLQRLQYTMSGDIYKEMFGEASEIMPEPTNEQEAMAVEMLKNLATMEMADLTFIVYIDEATGEMVKMEMDLGDMISTMMSGMTAILGEMLPEAMEVLNSIKANMVMEILNINNAKEFEIPEEALNAQDINELLQELQQLETSTEVEVKTE